MTKLLTLKHWQLFGLLVGLPMILQLITIGYMLTDSNLTFISTAFPILLILVMGLFFGWLYTLGTSLHMKLPKTAKMNLTKFKIFAFIPFVYMLFFAVFMFGGIFDISVGEHPNLAIFVLIIPLHLFSMYCIFYCLYFNAKALKAVEFQRAVTFNDCAGEFFLIWLFPIGIWIIQPRINKLFDTNNTINADRE